MTPRHASRTRSLIIPAAIAGALVGAALALAPVALTWVLMGGRP